MVAPSEGTPGTAAEGSSADAVGSLSRTLRWGATVSGAGLIIVQTVALVQTLVLARLLSPAEVGVFAAGTVLTVLLTEFAQGSLNQALIQRRQNVDDAADTVFWVTLANGVIASLAALALAPVVGRVFDNPVVGVVAATTSGIMLLHAVTTVPDALMHRRFQFSRRVIVDPAVAVTFAIVAITLAALGYGVWSLVIGYYASMGTWILASWWLCGWRPGRGRFSIRIWREMAVFAFPLLLDGVVTRVRDAVELMLIGHRLTDSAIGNYRYGRRIAMFPGLAIVQICSCVLFPAFSRIAEDPLRFRQAFLRALGWVWVAAMPMAAVLAAVGEPLTVVLLGEPWRTAGVALVAMSGFGLGEAMNSVSAESMKGAGRADRINWMIVAGLLSGIPLLVLLLPFGLAGVGLAISVSAVVVGVTGLVLARPIVGVSFADITRRMLPPTIASLLAYALIAPLEHFVMHSDQLPTAVGLGVIALEGLGFLVVYLGALRVVAPTTTAEIGQAITRALRRSAR
ncbi:oligosaccharide flippase family protein [Rhodococcus sp. T2V]|uniref:oligosaccharide flippase family protein n=1 Tax=Rhodococcus sp. T2V TaxID=3034164 RepID=UPI0023E1B6BD|nr:oligosaccharide flippase family protein [Rhodococcus sp. T2V]MDF3303689.1 oligosaccharide flippase family protein [Rhodococcus sp. T2V]